MNLIELTLEQSDLRINHKIKVDVCHNDAVGNFKTTVWIWNYDNNIGKWQRIGHIQSYELYEEALSAGLKIARGVLLEKNKD